MIVVDLKLYVTNPRVYDEVFHLNYKRNLIILYIRASGFPLQKLNFPQLFIRRFLPNRRSTITEFIWPIQQKASSIA